MDSRTTDKLVAAFKEQRDPIADSDLDDEQPVTLSVTLTLGEWRKLRRTQQARQHVTKVLRG
jgi:hypothetical protein